MKVHLIRSVGVPEDVFDRVVDILQSVNGALCFKPIEKPVSVDSEQKKSIVYPDAKRFSTKQTSSQLMSFNQSFPLERSALGWDALFRIISNIRKKYSIPDNEFLLLLTEAANDRNWFSALNEKYPFDGFIHTADWDFYLGASPVFPIAFEVVALVLQKHMFSSYAETERFAHRKPVGCVNDLCINKKDIMLKMRTADICSECMQRIDPGFPLACTTHALHILENLRSQMLFAQNFRQSAGASRLKITKSGKVVLPDYNEMFINLKPLEKVLYFLLLQHPEGIFQSNLSDYKEDMYRIYEQISNSGDLEEMRTRINQMANALDNSANEKISRIKKAFREQVGEKLMKHYIIQGEAGDRKKILLDRNLVVWEE